MGRHRIDAAELEERARVHAARIEEQDDELRALRRRLAIADEEHRVQAAIIRRRNAQIASLGQVLRQQVLAYAALARVRDRMRPAPGPVDTGTPGVYAEVTR
jgi:hypothetical protein